ncbi:MAG: hypothetical protein IT385_06510 [Deltaproteobacteria bacterium]|nr:hypothetical protein [Deltaproteobacteria bacterium]
MRALLLSMTACAAALVACGDSDDAADAARDSAQTTPTCATDADCDDQRTCTIDRCLADDGGALHCTWSVAPGACFIGNVCADTGEARPGDPCAVCDPATPLLWSVVADATPCDDGDACTRDTACSQGACRGTALDCDDGDTCTRDRCDAATGCVYERVVGATCDDGVRCTIDDRCDEETCAGVANPCDDGDPCTLDACNEVEGCTHAATEGLACEDGDACTSDDLCVDGACAAGAPTSCDDGNLCTVDTCDPDAGCAHLPTLSPCCIGVDSICDDLDPCTDDACDPLTGACSYVANTAVCDDGDPCTLDDACADSVCVGGRAYDCSDGNPCTADSCEASLPGLCLRQPLSTGACDDGLACSTGDACQAGSCVADTSACVCVPDLAVDGVKLTSIAIGESGHPGDGLDVDQKPATCAPEGSCSGGVDNTLSVISALANGSLADAVTSGQVMLVIELGSLAANPVEVAVYQARLVNAGCNHMTQTCDYLVDRAFLDALTCEPVARLTANVSGNTLTGGGPGTSLPFSIPFDEDTSLEVVIANLRIQATITRSGNETTGLTGLLGGAVPKQTLMDGIASLPDGTIPGVSTAAALQLVDLLVQNDIDTNGDGVKDAASIGVKIIAIDARLTGVE